MADASPHESAAVTLHRASATNRKQTNKPTTIFGTWLGRGGTLVWAPDRQLSSNVSPPPPPPPRESETRTGPASGVPGLIFSSLPALSFNCKKRQ